MAGLPKLPGFSFSDPTFVIKGNHWRNRISNKSKSITQKLPFQFAKYNRSQTFDLLNGYKIPKTTYSGIGGRELEKDSVKYANRTDPVRFDPSLTYGRTRANPPKQFLPHFVLYDQKCLTFRAFFRQSVVESPLEHYRIRKVNIIYFLEDDSITVMEPKTPNSGLDQGRLIRRAKISKNTFGDYWHWKDFAIGKDVAFNGIAFHVVDCDSFTREYMASQGLTMAEAEEMPFDPYTQNRCMQMASNTSKTPSDDDKLRRYLEYDGKILKFHAIFDDRDSEHGEMRKYDILYFLSDDTVAVKQIHEANSGRDPVTMLLRRIKLPKMYNDRLITFPSIYMEQTDHEVSEFYQPIDFQIGKTIFILGRKFLLYDCDKFTRNYYHKALRIDQGEPVDISIKAKPKLEKPIPPHDGIGSLEDSLQNTLSFLPKPPRKDVLRQIQNANKNLRYEMVMDTVHPEDKIRRFLLLYSLADCTCKIYEPNIRNSGISGGKYLRSTLLIKPGSDPLNPDYYSPSDFSIGAIINVFEQRFQITGADLYVYRYMQSNPSKFPCEVIENMRNYMYNKGYLNEDVEEQLEKNLDTEKKQQRDAIGREAVYKKTELEKCLDNINAGTDKDYEARTRARILQEYEDTLKRDPLIPPYGIQEVNKTCAYPIHIGDVKVEECGVEGAEMSAFTPKHIDNEDERVQKHYANVLRKQQELCKEPYDPPCADVRDYDQERKFIRVTAPELPEKACNVKQVKFAEVPDDCMKERLDLCNIKGEKSHRECVDYPPECRK